MNTPSSRSWQGAVLALLALGLVALALGGYLTPVTRLVLNPLVAAQTWITTRYKAISDIINSPSDLENLKQRNAYLEAENSRLQTQVIELQEQVSEVQVLSSLLDYYQAHPENQSKGASVIGFDTSPFMRYIFINRGSDDGVRRGMPVLTSQGLVGRVAAVTASASRVQLITDPGSVVNVRLQPSGAEAVLKGSVTGEVTLEDIPQDVNVQPGELVLTSGLGGNYPPNLLIGQVTGVRKRDYDLYQTASVQPIVDFVQVDIVLVITNFNPIDITPLMP